MCGFTEAEVADIRLAAGEALSNAVEHGRGTRSSGFSVACSYDNDALVVEVRDSGAGFVSPMEVGTIEPDERGRGFGIFLMRRLMDDVSFGAQRHGRPHGTPACRVRCRLNARGRS